MGAISGGVVGAAGIAVYIGAKNAESLPCPHALCRNRLPRQGLAVSHGWAEEDCPVCGGRVHFHAVHQWPSRMLDGGDKYLRVPQKEAP